MPLLRSDSRDRIRPQLLNKPSDFTLVLVECEVPTGHLRYKNIAICQHGI